MGCKTSRQNEVEGINKTKLGKNDFLGRSENSFLSDYVIEKEIGRGSYGTVFKVLEKRTKLVRSAKQIRISKDNKNRSHSRETLLNEIAILTQLDHPNLIKLFAYYEDENYIYLITDYSAGGNIVDNLHSTFGMEDRVARIVGQIIKALNYLHQKGIVHRDLKPENILFPVSVGDELIKIIDFGLSGHRASQNQRSGTLKYQAPEVLISAKNYSEKADLWSVGVIIFQMLTGDYPFEDLESSEIKSSISNLKSSLSKYSPEAQSFVVSILQYAETNRPSAANALKHEWLKKAKTVSFGDGNSPSKAPSMKLKKCKTIEDSLLFYVSQYVMQESELRNLQDLFNKIDLNNDGFINEEEFVKGYDLIFGVASKEVDYKELIAKIDLNKNTKIDYSEFVAFMVKSLEMMNEKHLKIAYSFFDKNEDGSIDFEEFSSVFKNKKRFPEQYLRNIFDQADSSNSGKLSYEAFKNAINAKALEFHKKLTL